MSGRCRSNRNKTVETSVAGEVVGFRWRALASLRLLCCCAALWLAAGCGERTGHSRLGREVLGDGEGWHWEADGRLIVAARDERAARFMARKGRLCLERIARVFNLQENDLGHPVIYAISEPEAWQSLIRRHDLEPGAVSVLDGEEMVCLAATEESWRSDAIPHELVHYVIRRQGWHIPLVLEEGTAIHFGWDANLAAHLVMGDVVQRPERRRPTNTIPMAELESMQAYPSSAEEVDAFYYQAERLTRGIQEQLDGKSYGVFLVLAGESGYTWRRALTEGFSLSPEQIAWIEQMTDDRQER